MKYLRSFYEYDDLDIERPSIYLPSVSQYWSDSILYDVEYCGYKKNNLVFHFDGIRKTQTDEGYPFPKSRVILSEYNITDVSKPLNETFFNAGSNGILFNVSEGTGAILGASTLNGFAISSSNNNNQYIRFNYNNIMLGNEATICVSSLNRPMLTGISNLKKYKRNSYSVEICFSITSLCGSDQFTAMYNFPWSTNTTDIGKTWGFTQFLFLCGCEEQYSGQSNFTVFPCVAIMYNAAINNENKDTHSMANLIECMPFVEDYLQNDYDNVIVVAIDDGVGEYGCGHNNMWCFTDFISQQQNEMGGTTTTIGHPFKNQYVNLLNNTVYTLSITPEYCVLYDHNNDDFLKTPVNSNKIYSAIKVSRDSIMDITFLRRTISSDYRTNIYIGNVPSDTVDIEHCKIFDNSSISLYNLVDTQFSSRIYSIRLYNDRLSKNDSLSNAKTDHLRFGFD